MYSWKADELPSSAGNNLQDRVFPADLRRKRFRTNGSPEAYKQ